MNLFTEVGVPVTLKAWSGATEKAPQHGETKVVKVTFAVELTPERASALVPADGHIKAVAYTGASDERLFLRAAQFDAVIGSQKLTIQSTPDSPVGIAFDHVKFSKSLAVKMADGGPVLLLRATIGPCGPSEYAYLGSWQGSQRFVTFEEAEPALPMDDDLTDADEKARQVTNSGPIPPAPMWDDDEAAAAQAESREAVATEQGHRYPKRGKKTTRKETAH